jgi:hypothetical protein
MKTLITATAVLALAATAIPAYAHTDRFQGRLERQAERIERGTASGALTRKETKRLRREQRDLRQLTRILSDGGRLSKWERLTLRHRFDDASDRIRQLKHNDRRRVHQHRHGWRDDWDRQASASATVRHRRSRHD